MRHPCDGGPGTVHRADSGPGSVPFGPLTPVAPITPWGLLVPHVGSGADDSGSDRPGFSRAAASPASRTERLRALIVEDEALIAIEIEDTLQALGVEVVGVALSAAQAVGLADTERPDFLTMDIRLQGDRDGVSAALEIYERFGIRSIFVSAYGDAETVARAEQASPLGWLTKPLQQERLERLLRGIYPPPR